MSDQPEIQLEEVRVLRRANDRLTRRLAEAENLCDKYGALADQLADENATLRQAVAEASEPPEEMPEGDVVSEKF